MQTGLVCNKNLDSKDFKNKFHFSGITAAVSSVNVTPIKKKKKRRLSDSDDDNDVDFKDVSTKKQEEPKVKKPVEVKKPKKSEDSTRTESSKVDKRKEEKERQHKKDKEHKHSSSKSGKDRDKHRDKDREDQERHNKKKEEKRKSVSAPVTPLKSSSSLHRPVTDQPRKNVEELSFKLAITSTSASSTLTSNDNSTEAIKKILNGDRVATSLPTKTSTVTSSKASPPVTPNKTSFPQPIPKTLLNGGNFSTVTSSNFSTDRNKLFPRPLPHDPSRPGTDSSRPASHGSDSMRPSSHGHESSKPATPKKIVEFNNQNNSTLDILGSIMSGMNSAAKKF